jgi:cytochrome c biogenesis protein CcmG/thiol:disulfide interchange protein DsbE
MKAKFLIPLLIFLVIAGFLAVGLVLDPKEVPSPLIGKPAPALSLPALDDPSRIITTEEFKGKTWMLNVWATWCVSCRAEHRVLVDMARHSDIPIVGLDYKDDAADAKRWLQQLGNPYVVTAFDEKGRIAIDWGVYGTPETYVIDKAGIIRFKQIGPINTEVLQDKILPLIKQLEEEGA